jgi:hypothetical protein
MSKLFHYNKCPYKQLSEHRGHAIIFCNDRVRSIFIKMKNTGWDDLMLKNNKLLNCSSFKELSIKQLLTGMRRYDLYCGVEIEHIEFY